jgi:AraC-like DNA-binding protein
MHDYYVVCFIEQGLQSFSHHKVKHLTPPGGLIVLNPGDDHTGEPADNNGFRYRALYPTLSHMQEAISEITENQEQPPFFADVRIDDPELVQSFRALHLSLTHEKTPIECESLFITALSQLILKHSQINAPMERSKKEHRAVQTACCYIHEHMTEGFNLTTLAGQVGLSRFYFLRVFCDEIGMPPHTYLESIRISKAKQLLESGMPINHTALELGFSDQSHFTNSFRRFIGTTPGQYMSEIKNRP